MSRRWLVRVLGHPAVSNIRGLVRSIGQGVDVEPVAAGEYGCQSLDGRPNAQASTSAAFKPPVAAGALPSLTPHTTGGFTAT